MTYHDPLRDVFQDLDQLRDSTIFCEDGRDYFRPAEWKRKVETTRESNQETGTEQKYDGR